MTRARIKCAQCGEYIDYDISRDKATCKNVRCGYVMHTYANMFKRDKL